VRVTWLVVCEKLAHLTDGSHHALRLYLDPLPWRPPAVHLPIAAAFILEGEQLGPVPVVVRLLTPRGTPAAELRAVLPAAPADVCTRSGFLEAHVSIDGPGDYEVQALVEGQSVDDAPTWRIRFLPTGG
jgi:hypothetical protein